VAAEIHPAEQARIAFEAAVLLHRLHGEAGEFAFRRDGGDLPSHARRSLSSLLSRAALSRSRVMKPMALQAHRLAAAEPISTSSPGPSFPAIPSSSAIFSPA